MRFEAQRGDGLLRIERYVGQGFRAGGRDWPDGVLATPEAAFPPGDFAPLDAAEPPIELVLIGTGSRTVRPDPATLDTLLPRFAVEWMDSRAAARTYNVLVLEGRRVAAMLSPIEP